MPRFADSERRVVLDGRVDRPAGSSYPPGLSSNGIVTAEMVARRGSARVQMFISGRVGRCGSEAHVVVGAPRPVAGSARSDKVCHVEIRWADTIVRLHPQPGPVRVALDNALGEVTRHLGIDLRGLLVHVAIGPALPEPQAW
ncbi:hypothetical protein ACFXO9_34470 [Nocardia tengchongensis]|uniref:hypothetical protein n=1 Tax=Nocardia tengchongensis TaxID=2055889 RepID=UPI003692A4F3